MTFIRLNKNDTFSTCREVMQYCQQENFRGWPVINYIDGKKYHKIKTALLSSRSHHVINLVNLVGFLVA